MEVGCGAGGTGELLKKMGVSQRTGIEVNADAARLARPHYTRMIVGDVERLDLSFIPPGSLDCILYPDVLEHLWNPWLVLRRHLALLRAEGFVAASIPNIQYYRAVRSLVFSGRWDYSEAGILDIGHIRFFTWKSIQELFTGSGLEIVRVIKNVRGSGLLRLANKVLLNRLEPFLVKQYLVLGRKQIDN
jgi:predicted TPR repeat methyltransferase